MLIPAFILILLYLGMHIATDEFSVLELKYFKVKSTLMLIPALVALIFLFNIMVLGGSFYAKENFKSSSLDSDTFADYLRLGENLKHYASFHETLGDYFLKYHKNEIATREFNLAKNISLNPKLLTKLATCYKVANKLDSSEIAFKQIIAIDPTKLTPKFLLLQLLEQKKDSAQIKRLAEIIIQAPIKYKTKKAILIKNYADSILKMYNI